MSLRKTSRCYICGSRAGSGWCELRPLAGKRVCFACLVCATFVLPAGVVLGGGPGVPPGVIRRRMVGLKILADGRAFPQAWALYDVDYSDGSRKIERGHSIHALPGGVLSRGTKRQRTLARQAYRPELCAALRAAFVLQQDIEAACRRLDELRGQGEMAP